MTGLQWTVLSLGLRCGRNQMVAGARVVLKVPYSFVWWVRLAAVWTLAGTVGQSTHKHPLCVACASSQQSRRRVRELGKTVLPFLT